MSDSAVEVTNLLHRYVACVDNADALGASAFFRYGKAKFSGDNHYQDEATSRNMFRRIFTKSYPFGPPFAKHVITNPIVEVDEAANLASVRAYYTHVKEITPASGDAPMQTCGAGRYFMRFHRLNGIWQFASRADVFEAKGKYADIPDFPADQGARSVTQAEAEEGITRLQAGSAVAIINLVGHYAELLDNGDLHGAAGLLEHANLQRPGSEELLDEAATFALLQQELDVSPGESPRTKHLVTNPLLHVDESANTATCRSHITVVRWGNDLPMQIVSTGRYFDRFERVRGTWQFSHRRYVPDLARGNGATRRPTSELEFGVARSAAQNSAVQVANLLYRYAELIDNGDLVAAADLFEHARLRLNGFHKPQVSNQLLGRLRESVRLYPCGTARTKHLITNPIIEVDEISNRAMCSSVYTILQATQELPLQVICIGRHLDRFERVDGSWRFVYRDFTTVDAIGDRSGHLQNHLPQG